MATAKVKNKGRAKPWRAALRPQQIETATSNQLECSRVWAWLGEAFKFKGQIQGKGHTKPSWFRPTSKIESQVSARWSTTCSPLISFVKYAKKGLQTITYSSLCS